MVINLGLSFFSSFLLYPRITLESFYLSIFIAHSTSDKLAPEMAEIKEKKGWQHKPIYLKRNFEKHFNFSSENNRLWDRMSFFFLIYFLKKSVELIVKISKNNEVWILWNSRSFKKYVMHRRTEFSVSLTENFYSPKDNCN